MNLRLPLILLPVCATALFLGAASPLDERFKEFDRNNDGVIAGDEFDSAVYLRKLDLDGDGKVTHDEARDAIAKLGRKIVQEFRERRENGSAGMPPIKAPVELQEGPQPVKAAERGVGHVAPELTLKKLDGGSARLAPSGTGRVVVLGFFSATCPLSGKLGPEMARLEKEYGGKGVSFTWLGAPPASNPEEIKAYVSTHQLAGTIALDADGAVARELRAETTTEVFVFDAARTLVYRGAINDQYGLGYSLDAPKHHFLREALDLTLRGELPAMAATTAPGCALDLPKDNLMARSPATYHRDIARILNQNCVECHRDGGLAPFSLTSHEDVIEHAGMIRKQVERGVMPPWFASAAQSGAHATFSNDRSLSKADKAALLAWLNSDRPKGNAADAPLPRKFPEGWLIGEPDFVAQLPRPVAIKAEGIMPYQNITVPLNLSEDRWVQSYEIVPTDRKVVHHVIVRVVEAGGKASRRDGDNETDGLWAAYVPGNSTRILPDGFAKKLPAGASLHFQIHYTPAGKATEDQLKIGLKFAPKPPQYIVHVTGLANPRINIPPNDPDHIESLTRVLPTDMLVSGFMPHMHVRGKSFKYEVTTPDGKTETLLDVPSYDFNWQLQYRLAQPKVLPRGSTMRVTAVYDNSSGNRANPDPSKTVRWGQQTSDEMMIGYVEHFVPNKDDKMAAAR